MASSPQDFRAALDRIRASSRGVTPPPPPRAVGGVDPEFEFDLSMFAPEKMPPRDTRGFLRKAYDWAATPLVDLGGWGHRKALELTDPNDDPGMLRSFGAGALEGLSNVINGFTSPLGIASTVSGFAAPAAAARGFTGASNALRAIDAATAAPAVGMGLYDAATGDDTDARLAGLAQAIAGGTGAGLALRGAPRSRGAVAPAEGTPLTMGGITYKDLQNRTGGAVQPGTLQDLPFSRQTMPRHTPQPVRAGELARGAERFVGPDLLRSGRELQPPIPEGPITTGLERVPERPTGTRQAPMDWVTSMDNAEIDAFYEALGVPRPPSRPRQVFPEMTLAEGMEPEPLTLSPKPERIRVPGSTPTEPLAMAGAQQRSLFQGAPDDLLEVLDPYSSRLNANASGESAASIEALNRSRSMRDRGEQFVVYDRTGARRPLIGPDAVDYTARQGETYGIEGPSGFRALDDLGGRPPTAATGGVGRPALDTGQRGAVGVLDAPAPPIAPGAQEVEDLIASLAQVEKAGLDPSVLDRFAPDDPRGYPTLPNRERQAMRGLDREFQRRIDDEAGFIAPELQAMLARTGLGAFVGGSTGAAMNDDNRLLGALEGGTLGAAVANPRLAGKALSKLQATRYFSMLSSPLTHAKNVAGAAGAVGTEALERALSGRGGEAADILRQVFNPATLDNIVAEFKTPQFADASRWGSIEGTLGIPARAMSAIDAGAAHALERAGIPPDLAREITFTSEPKSDIGKWITSRPELASLPIPFPRVATNIVERGIEHTPILGSIAQALTGGKMKTSAAKQLMGAMAAAGGFASAEQINPYLSALLGPLALPASMGAAAGAAGDGGDATMYDRLKAGMDAFVKSTPLPTNAFAFDPASWLAQLVPNVGRDISALAGVDPKSFDTKGSLTAPALAKVPGLNEALLERKPAKRAKSTRRERRNDR